MGTALNTFNIVAGSAVAAGLGYAHDVSAVAPAAVAVAGGVGMLVRDRVAGAGWPTALYRCGCWLSAGMWTAWSTVTSPWTVPTLAAGAAATLVGALIAPAFARPDDDVADGLAADAPRATRDPRGLVWADRIQRLASVQPVTITRVEDWDTGTGFTLHVTFAVESGDTWTKVRDVTPRLAAADRLAKGSAISVDEGDIQGTAVVRVPTVYAFDKDLPLPEDTSPLSVWTDFPIGGNEDGTPALVNLRQAAGLFAGRRGGGKSNLLKVLAGQILRCPDSLIWVVDLNGGGLAVPFMLPYAKGEVDVPPIDWVAASPDEAIAMAQVAADIARDRKARYAALTAQADSDLLPVNADLPQITILVDESAEVENNAKAKGAMEAFQEVLRIGRADAVNVLFSALRATQETIPVNTRKQTTLKICGQVEDEAEIHYVLPNSKVRPEDLVHPGTVFVRRSDIGPGVRQVKVYRTLPSKIRRVVMDTQHLRPKLDEAGVQVGGKAYAARWERLEPWLARIRGERIPVTVASTTPTGPTGERRATTAEPVDRDELRRRARRGLARVVTDSRLADDRAVRAEFAALTADLKVTEANEPTEVVEQGGDWTSPELLVTLVADAGPDGITPTQIRQALTDRGITRSMKTIHEHLGRFVEQGRLVKGPDRGRYRLP